MQIHFFVLRTTKIEGGLEQRFFYDVLDSEENLQVGQLSGDFRGTVLALQLTNPTTYLGYKLITEVGMRYDRRSLERVGGKRQQKASGLFFASMLVGPALMRLVLCIFMCSTLKKEERIMPLVPNRPA